MKSIALFTIPTKPEAIVFVEAAAKILDDLGVEVIAGETFCEKLDQNEYSFIQPCDENDFKKRADFVVSFGGDGTILSASKLLMNSGIPIMGFNVGKLGFLAEYNTDHLKESLEDLINGNYRVVERSV